MVFLGIKLGEKLIFRIVLVYKMCVGSVTHIVDSNLRSRLSVVPRDEDPTIKVRSRLAQSMSLLTLPIQSIFIAVNAVTWSTDVLLSVVFVVSLMKSRTGSSM